jgi:ribonuclease E
MRTAASAGLSALRIIEDEAARGRGDRIMLRAGKEAAVYVLNKKRAELADIEERYGVSIEILIDEGFEGARMTVETSGGRPIAAPRVEAAPSEEEEPEEELDEDETVEISLEGEEEGEEAEPRGEEREGEREGERHPRRRRRRRRGGRGRGRRDGAESEAEQSEEQPEVAADERPSSQADADPELKEEGGKRRRRRRGRKPAEAGVEAPRAEEIIEPESSPMVERPIDEEPPIAQTGPAEEPQPKSKRRRSKKAAGEVPAEAEIAVPEPAPASAPPAETADEAGKPAKPARKRRTKSKEGTESATEEPVSVPAANNDTAAEAGGEPRRGWWQRTFG